MNYTYDESGIHFVYFVLTMLALVLVPFTWKTVTWHLSNRSTASHCRCSGCKAKLRYLCARRPSLWRKKRFHFLVVGWTLFVVLAVHLWRHGKLEKATFDPFEILGITSSSSDKEIRKAYLVLSLRYHPDKVPEEERPFAQDRFVQITKAYKCLTDPVTKSNYELYGNPDGVSTNDIGIALPSWLIDSKNLSLVIGVYCVAFMVALPWYIGKWWRASSKYTKDNVMHLSMVLFYRELKETMQVKRILELITAAAEFKEDLEWKESDSIAVPAFYNSIRPAIEEMTGEKFEPSSKYTAPYAVKAYCLLYAHLYRLEVPVENGLKEAQQFVVQKSLILLNGLIQICLARSWVGCMKTCLSVVQLIVQALPENGHQLLQLPHVTLAMAKEFKNRKRNVKSIKEFLTLSDTDRKIAMSDATDQEFSEIVRVAHSFPCVEFSQLKAAVLGYDEVVCGSVITLQVRLHLTTIRNSSEAGDLQSNEVPVVNNQPESEALLSNLKFDEEGNLLEGEEALNSDFHYAPPSSDSYSDATGLCIHAPYFYAQKVPVWWIIVSDSEGDFVCAPKRISNIPTAPSSLSDKQVASFGRLVTFQFPAPSKPTTLGYVVSVKADFCVGFDLQRDIRIPVVQDRTPLYDGGGEGEHRVGKGKRPQIAEYEGLSDDEEETFNL